MKAAQVICQTSNRVIYVRLSERVTKLRLYYGFITRDTFGFLFLGGSARDLAVPVPVLPYLAKPKARVK